MYCCCTWMILCYLFFHHLQLQLLDFNQTEASSAGVGAKVNVHWSFLWLNIWSNIAHKAMLPSKTRKLNSVVWILMTTTVLIAVYHERKIMCPTKIVENRDLMKCFCNETNQHGKWNATVSGCELERFSLFSVNIHFTYLTCCCVLCFLLISRVSKVSGSLQVMASWFSHFLGMNEYTWRLMQERPGMKDLVQLYHMVYDTYEHVYDSCICHVWCIVSHYTRLNHHSTAISNGVKFHCHVITWHNSMTLHDFMDHSFLVIYYKCLWPFLRCK